MFWDLIYELAADRGMTVLVTTHYMDEAEQCDRLAFILNGELIADGTPREIKSRSRAACFEVEPRTIRSSRSKRRGRTRRVEDAYLLGVALRAVAPPESQDIGRRSRARDGRPRRAVARGRVRLAGPEQAAAPAEEGAS